MSADQLKALEVSHYTASTRFPVLSYTMLLPGSGAVRGVSIGTRGRTQVHSATYARPLLPSYAQPMLPPYAHLVRCPVLAYSMLLQTCSTEMGEGQEGQEGQGERRYPPTSPLREVRYCGRAPAVLTRGREEEDGVNASSATVCRICSATVCRICVS
eukprot:3754000-Rhodomonas_salina.1